MNIQLKKASNTDILLIQQLAQEIWNKHYVEIIGREQVDYMLQTIYAADAMQKQMKEGQQYYLIASGKEIAGFLSVSREKEEKAYMLNKFYLLQSEQQKGLGTAVFKELIKELQQPEIIRLTVNRQNYKSINFYFKNGFKIEQVADFDIGNGYFMNDFVMGWSFAKSGQG